MDINPGDTGAKRQSWDKYNARDLIRQEIKNNPKGTERAIAEAVWEIIKNERGYWKSIFEYWFTNNYRSFVVKRTTEHEVVVEERPPHKRASANMFSHDINNAKAQIKTILMDQVLSTGKKLRDSTFGECATEGGWLLAVAKQGNPNAIVGKHLTEKDLWALRMRATGK